MAQTTYKMDLKYSFVSCNTDIYVHGYIFKSDFFDGLKRAMADLGRDSIYLLPINWAEHT